MTRDQGFTLMELLLAMAIMMILSVVGIGAYTQATLKSRDTERKNDLNQIAKSLEMFMNDVQRYPHAVDGVMMCPGRDGTEVACGDQIYSYTGTLPDREMALYMQSVPEDPVDGREYVYQENSLTGGYSLYASLENTEDRDVVVDEDGNSTDWDISCGTVECNYKLTETGLVRAK